MSPSPPHSDDDLGPVEQELVRILRGLELGEIDDGRRDRCWQEFRALARIPEPVAPPESEPALDEEPARPRQPATNSASRETDRVGRWLRPLPGSPG